MPDTIQVTQVAAPAESGKAPYLSDEVIRRLAALAERLERIAPEHAQVAEARQGAQTVNGLGLPMGTFIHSPDEWQRAQTELAEAAAAARAERTYLPMREVATRQVARSILTEGGFCLPNGRMVRLSEAISTREFPTLLRAGLRTILFNSFSETPTTYDQICEVYQSNKQAEVWLEMARTGAFGQVDEGEEYPRVQVTQLPERRVANVKYGEIIPITEEMVKFDLTNQIMQIPADRGAAARQTLDNTFYTAFKTTGNYTKTSADNNIGNNTSSNVFSPSNFITAWETVTTMKEARSGRYLNIVPNVLVCGSGVLIPATQLFKSASIQSGASATSTTAAVGVGGPGATNPLFGVVSNIIVSPFMTRYEWALGVAKRGWVYQEVEPLSLVDRVQPDAQEAFVRDVYEYKARLWFGFGIRDDRFWYYSNASTVPTWT